MLGQTQAEAQMARPANDQRAFLASAGLAQSLGDALRHPVVTNLLRLGGVDLPRSPHPGMNGKEKLKKALIERIETDLIQAQALSFGGRHRPPPLPSDPVEEESGSVETEDPNVLFSGRKTEDAVVLIVAPPSWPVDLSRELLEGKLPSQKAGEDRCILRIECLQKEGERSISGGKRAEQSLFDPVVRGSGVHFPQVDDSRILQVGEKVCVRNGITGQEINPALAGCFSGRAEKDQGERSERLSKRNQPADPPILLRARSGQAVARDGSSGAESRSVRIAAIRSMVRKGSPS